MADAKEREARERVLKAMHKPMSMVIDRERHQAENAALLGEYRAALVEEIVAKVEAESRTLLRDADDVALDRLAFANRLIDTIRGLAAPTTEEG